MIQRHSLFRTFAALGLALTLASCATRPPPAGPEETTAEGGAPSTIATPTTPPQRNGFFSGISRALGAGNSVPNAGPCPSVRVLYEASRFVELDGPERFENVGFTGEIQKVDSFCRYSGTDPVTAEVTVDFAFGRGPKASGTSKTVSYWVAVTRRDIAPIAKERFALNASFPAGATRLTMKDTINRIVIPRANKDISGGNFEILIGFDLTPDQLTFNRDGKRFRVDSGPSR